MMLPEPLSPKQQEFAATYSGLNHQEKILFATVFLYCSTLEARCTYEEGTEGIEDPVRLRGLNELQHRISDHLVHLVTDYQKRRPDDDFLSLVLHLSQRYKVSLGMVLEKFNHWK